MPNSHRLSDENWVTFEDDRSWTFGREPLTQEEFHSFRQLLEDRNELRNYRAIRVDLSRRDRGQHRPS